MLLCLVNIFLWLKIYLVWFLNIFNHFLVSVYIVALKLKLVKLSSLDYKILTCLYFRILYFISHNFMLLKIDHWELLFFYFFFFTHNLNFYNLKKLDFSWPSQVIFSKLSPYKYNHKLMYYYIIDNKEEYWWWHFMWSM